MWGLGRPWVQKSLPGKASTPEAAAPQPAPAALDPASTFAAIVLSQDPAFCDSRQPLTTTELPPPRLPHQQLRLSVSLSEAGAC